MSSGKLFGWIAGKLGKDKIGKFEERIFAESNYE